LAGFKTYISETYNELIHEVSWPTWKELQSSAILVLVASAIIAALVFLMDFVFGINGGAWKGILGFVYQLLSDMQ
jgi:preprotein translocase subunit SecE